MRIAALQFDIEWEDRAVNYNRVKIFAKQAAEEGADLLVLPEMFATGFSLNPQVTAEDNPGETAQFLCQTAKELEMGVLGGLVFRADGGRGVNTSLVVDKHGRVKSSYAKTHLFSFMGEEKFHQSGDGPKTFELEGTNCACFICYDLRFPEIFRLVADRTECVFVIASWPAARQRHWDVLLPARAVENQQYIVGVNRIGQGGGLVFEGGSAIYGPLGNCLSNGGSDEKLMIADIEPGEVHRIRKEMPFLSDRKYL